VLKYTYVWQNEGVGVSVQNYTANCVRLSVGLDTSAQYVYCSNVLLVPIRLSFKIRSGYWIMYKMNGEQRVTMC